MTAAECRSADRQCWLTSGYARERHHQAAALCLFGPAIHLQACRQFAMPGGAKILYYCNRILFAYGRPQNR